MLSRASVHLTQVIQPSTRLVFSQSALGSISVLANMGYSWPPTALKGTICTICLRVSLPCYSWTLRIDHHNWFVNPLRSGFYFGVRIRLWYEVSLWLLNCEWRYKLSLVCVTNPLWRSKLHNSFESSFLILVVWRPLSYLIPQIVLASSPKLSTRVKK
jgi:hypothetical protein